MNDVTEMYEYDKYEQHMNNLNNLDFYMKEYSRAWASLGFFNFPHDNFRDSYELLSESKNHYKINLFDDQRLHVSSKGNNNNTIIRSNNNKSTPDRLYRKHNNVFVSGSFDEILN